MNNKILLTALTVAATVLVSGSSFAFLGFGGGEKPQDLGPQPQTTEVHTQIQEAIEHEDYEMFNELTPREVSQEEFASIITRRAEAETRRAEREEHRQAVQEAVQNEDYDARKALQQDDERGAQMVTLIDTAEKFAKLVQLHDLREQMETLRQELGLDTLINEKRMQRGQGIHQNMNMRNGTRGMMQSRKNMRR